LELNGNNKKWVDVEELASYIGCSKSTIYHKVSAGEIPHSKKMGLRFYLPDIDAWLMDENYFHPKKLNEWVGRKLSQITED